MLKRVLFLQLLALRSSSEHNLSQLAGTIVSTVTHKHKVSKDSDLRSVLNLFDLDLSPLITLHIKAPLSVTYSLGMTL